ncbi:TRAP transporter small permease [Alcaligenaceae bacterium]|nr:TRAP transporter small permease [Alcaligenaceae bacterium]
MHAATPVQHRNPMHRFRHGYGKALEWVVGALMVILAIEVTVGVVFRWTGNSLVWYDETASLLLAWLTFYGSALASVRRAHIGCPEVVDSLGPRGRRSFNIVAQLLVIAFFALLGWMGLVIMPILAGDFLVSLPWVPVNFVHSAIPISAVLILIAEVMHLIDLIRTPDDANTASALSDGLV